MVSSFRVLIVSAIAFLAATITAHAADFGPLNLGDTQPFNEQIGIGASTTDFTFELQTGSVVQAVVESIDFAPFLAIDDAGFTLELFNVDGPETQVGSTGLATDGVISIAISSLDPGNYLLRVTGTGSGSAGGLFAGAVAVVPLPANIYLMISALATFVLFGRLRRNKAA